MFFDKSECEMFACLSTRVDKLTAGWIARLMWLLCMGICSEMNQWFAFQFT